MMTDVDETHGIPPPPLADRTTDHLPPVWTTLIQNEKYSDHCSRLCENIFVPGKTIKRQPPTTCSYNKKCSFAHEIRKLQPPSAFRKNTPLPEDAPEELKYIVTSDWGCRHRERPRLEIPFEETYPSKMTRLVKCILAGNDPRCSREMPAPGQHFSGVLCHTWTFYGKCPFWQNCNYLHVEQSVIKEHCRRYKCQVNDRTRVCSYKHCPYAHDTKLLTIPDKMQKGSAYPGLTGESPRELVLESEDGTRTVSKFELKKKYIAKTDGCDSSFMCNNSWCTLTAEAQCCLVHLLPEAWIDDAFQNVRGERPAVPRYFANLVSMSKAAHTKHVHPVENCWASWSAAVRLNQQATSLPAEPPRQGVTSSSTQQHALSLDFPPLHQTPHPVSPQRSGLKHHSRDRAQHKTAEVVSIGTSELGDTISLSGSPCGSSHCELIHDSASVSEPECFLDLLELPVYREFKPTNLKVFAQQQRVKDKWAGGVSPRFNAHYTAWMESGQMNKAYLADGGVLTHSQINSELGCGFAAKVWLGVTAADGREVALKIFRPDSEADQEAAEIIQKHLIQETTALKRHGAIPGVVQYLGSFEKQVIDEDEGTTQHIRVVVLELMEGTLQEAVRNWDSSVFGTLQHLHLVRYVLGSMLDILGQLNHGQYQSLVHRDVKPDNIMIDRYKNIRLIDFGTSRVIDKLRKSMTVSTTDGTLIYSSPEARQQRPEAHLTSDLYSIGVVAHYLMIGRDPGMIFHASKPCDPVPADWPPYHRAAMQHLHKELTKLDPNERGLNSFARSTGTSHHRILLAHPVFWTARKGISFLVALGNYKEPPIHGMSDAVASCYGDGGWYPLVQQYESQTFPVSPSDKASSWALLRFIRNQYTHATDPSTDRAVIAPLLERPVLLELFPRLVLECWMYLLRHMRLISREHPSLASYLRSGWDAQAVRNPDEESQWS